MKSFVKNEKAYQKVEFDAKSIKRAYEKRKKVTSPTSISLPEEIVIEIRNIAQKKGIPYKTMMRMLIVEGLVTLRKSA